jgi:hypothetical protein
MIKKNKNPLPSSQTQGVVSGPERSPLADMPILKKSTSASTKGDADSDLLSREIVNKPSSGLFPRNPEYSLIRSLSAPVFSGQKLIGVKANRLSPIESGVRAIDFLIVWKSLESLNYHFKKHQKEFPDIGTQQGYRDEAIRFWRIPIVESNQGLRKNIIESMGSRQPKGKDEGNIHKLYRFEYSTGILSIAEPDKDRPGQVMVTMFKPAYNTKSETNRLAKAEAYFDKHTKLDNTGREAQSDF